PSQLERRLLLILDPCQNRRPISRRRMILATVGALTLLSALSVLRVEATAAGGEQLAQKAAENAQTAPAERQATDRAKTIADRGAQITDQYGTPVDEQESVQGAIKGMLGALHDPYSDYLTPEMVAQM